ncbi:hypothetical protein RAB80_009168 [Fusarium oxysporum f. sp. vasinfectum]|nr:hypothetical protein RAB80_009168 [Fusarium oxysporum f. sp. vasinfectum]
MVSLRDIGLLLLAAPIAMAAPKAPSEVTIKTIPFSKPEDTSKAPSTSAVASPASDAAQKAACQLPPPLHQLRPLLRHRLQECYLRPLHAHLGSVQGLSVDERAGEWCYIPEHEMDWGE